MSFLDMDERLVELIGKGLVLTATPITDLKIPPLGTDLGIIVKFNGTFRYIFGDTFGGEFTTQDDMAGKEVNSRSNVMAVSTDDDFTDGITINYWFNDTTKARELVSSLKTDNVEMTTIPTAVPTATTDNRTTP